MRENLILNSEALARVFVSLLAVEIVSCIIVFLIYNRYYHRKIQTASRGKIGLTPKRFAIFSLVVHLIILAGCMLKVHMDYNAPYVFPDTDHRIELIEKTDFEAAVQKLELADSFSDQANTCTEIYINPDNATEAYLRVSYQGQMAAESVFIHGSYEYKPEHHFGILWDKSITDDSLMLSRKNTEELFLHLVNMDARTYISLGIWWMDYIPDPLIETRPVTGAYMMPYSEREHVLDFSSDSYFLEGIHGREDEHVQLDYSSTLIYSTETFEMPEAGYFAIIAACAFALLCVACWWTTVSSRS